MGFRLVDGQHPQMVTGTRGVGNFFEPPVLLQAGNWTHRVNGGRQFQARN